MKKLNHFTMHASKVLEVLFWIATGAVVLGLIASCIGMGWANRAIRSNEIDLGQVGQIITADPELGELGSNEVEHLMGLAMRENDILRADGTINVFSVVLTLVSAAAHCGVFAMLFRNIYLILRTAEGRTWFSKGDTPFQADITRMVREIGIFLLALAALELVFSLLVPFLTFDLVYVVIGILMLCLSSIFRYGEDLQQDRDGLI